jgi:drug/metabolite transporter (DMT)-like permease
MTRAELERDVVIVVCGISAGIHAALVPEHAREAAAAGVGFAASAVLLAGLAVVLTRRPGNVPAAAGAGAVLLGLIASWILAVTTGLPVLHPEPEPVEALALVTKAIEAAGLLVAVHLLLEQRPANVHLHLTTKGLRT